MSTAQSVEELKRLVDPLRVYEEYVRLSRSGRRAKGLCPFHREKTPSFQVDVETGLFHCFGCHAGGDVLTFLEKVESCSFVEALEILAHKGGVTLARTHKSSGPAPDVRERMRKLLASAAEHYRRCLKESQGTSPIRNYMRQRGIGAEAESSLGLGYAPPAGGLMAALSRAGYQPQEVREAGLTLERGGGDSERFRNRLLFPIHDTSGRVAGFGGRAIDGEEPKYLNSPESPVFQKRDLLYGLHLTKGAIRDAKQAVLVEGYMDFLALHQAGVPNAVATLGTAVGDGQARLLKRYADEVVLNFDRDAAGLAAAKRAIQAFLAHGLRIKVALIPSGKDPDDFIRASGAEAYPALIRGAKPFFTFLAEQAQEGAPLHQVEGDLKVLNELAEYLRAIPDPLERTAYAEDLAGRLRMKPSQILRRISEAPRGGAEETASPQERAPNLPHNQQILVSGLLRFPEAAAAASEMLSREAIPSLAAGPLLASLIAGRGPEGPEQAGMMAFIRNSFHEAPSMEDTLAAAASIAEEQLTARERSIQQQIREASQRRDQGLVQILNREKMALAKRRQDMGRT